MRRRLILLLPPVAATVALARSPYLAPLIYGVRQWMAARPETEGDLIG